jgi:hypothetical protein
LKLKLDARRASSDQMALRCELPVAEGFDPDGAEVHVSVGGVTRKVVLDVRGRRTDAAPGVALGALPDAAEAVGARLRVRRKKGVVQSGAVRFDLKLTRADVGVDVADEALDTSRRQRREPRAITVFVLFDGGTYEATVPLLQRANAGRVGRARDVR